MIFLELLEKNGTLLFQTVGAALFIFSNFFIKYNVCVLMTKMLTNKKDFRSCSNLLISYKLYVYFGIVKRLKMSHVQPTPWTQFFNSQALVAQGLKF